MNHHFECAVHVIHRGERERRGERAKEKDGENETNWLLPIYDVFDVVRIYWFSFGTFGGVGVV